MVCYKTDHAKGHMCRTKIPQVDVQHKMHVVPSLFYKKRSYRSTETFSIKKIPYKYYMQKCMQLNPTSITSNSAVWLVTDITDK